MAKKISGWYNGFNLDIDRFTVPYGIIFRVFGEADFDVRGCSQRTLGLDGIE